MEIIESLDEEDFLLYRQILVNGAGMFLHGKETARKLTNISPGQRSNSTNSSRTTLRRTIGETANSALSANAEHLFQLVPLARPL